MTEKQKIVYLTIDDCPSKDFRRKIDFLIKNNIPAILFCIGKNIEKYEKDVIYAVKRGFIIGNHSYSHPDFDITSIKEAEFQIKFTDQIINKIYKKAKKKRKIKVFRFPYGFRGLKWRGIKIEEILKESGYKNINFRNVKYSWFKKTEKNPDILWTYDISEHKLKSLEEIIKRIIHRSGWLSNKTTREVLLIHDHEKTTKWFFKILEKLIEKKIKFVLPKIK